MSLPTPDPSRLRAHVRRLEGERHPDFSPAALAAAEEYVAGCLEETGWAVEARPFAYGGRSHRNIVARRPGGERGRPRVLVGAHLDTVPGTPGADDNASGVAVLLEVGRILGSAEPEAPLELVAFNLEEPQGATYRVGSRRFAAAARREGVEYAGCLILEMVGYTDPAPGSQRVPGVLFWKDVPDAGTFLAAASDLASRDLLARFAEAAREAAPELELVTLRVPLRGWLVPQTRLSDNASFWDEGYPALMLTDTSFLRNPHYHAPTDRLETLDFEFMERVGAAVATTAAGLAVRAG